MDYPATPALMKQYVFDRSDSTEVDTDTDNAVDAAMIEACLWLVGRSGLKHGHRVGCRGLRHWWASGAANHWLGAGLQARWRAVAGRWTGPWHARPWCSGASWGHTCS